MTVIITAFERSPDGGKGWRVTRVRWALEEVGQPYEFALFRSAHRNPLIGRSSIRQDPDLRGRRSCLIRQARSSSISPSTMRPAAKDANARARSSPGCSPRSIQWSRRSSSRKRQATGGRQAVEQGTLASGRGSRPQAAGPTFRSPGRSRLARWCIQRGRPDDGVGAAEAEIIRDSGRVSDLAAYVSRGETRPAYKRAFAAQLAINASR